MCTSLKYVIWFLYFQKDVSVNDNVSDYLCFTQVSDYLCFTTYTVNIFASSQILYEIIEKVTKVKTTR